MDKLQLVYESYNQMIERGYEKLFAENKGDDILKMSDEKIGGILEPELRRWEITPVSGLEGLSPQEFFRNISNVGYAIEAFKAGARICDSAVPRLLLEKLDAFKEEAVDELVKLAGENERTDNPDESCIPVAAIRALGRLKGDKAVAPLFDLLYSLSEDRENIVEEISDALAEIGEPIIEPAVRRINQAAEIGYIDEYVLNALVKAGKSNKDDSIFRCLKEAFGRMEDKVLGALCLGDYGDGRAIPALRGYIEKNRASTDKRVFLEIAAAIKRLGGNVEDLVKKTAF